MQKQIIFRLGLAGVLAVAGGASAAVVGCSSDDNTESGGDAGPDSSGFPDSGDDSSSDDGGSDVDSAPPPPNAKLTLLHAAPGVFPFRFCFGVQTSGGVVVAPGIFALPNNAATQPAGTPYLGLFPGTGGVVPQFGVNIANIDIVGFVIKADIIAGVTNAVENELDCSQLIGSDGTGGDAGLGLTLGTDYFQLPTIPKGTLAAGQSYLLALEGCVPGNPFGGSTQAICGADYTDPTMGNVSVNIFQIDNSTPSTSTMGLQFVHASSAWDGVLSATPVSQHGFDQPFANTVSVYDTAIDGGGGNPPVATAVNFGPAIYPGDAGAAPQTIDPTDYASLNLVLTATAPDGGPLAFPNPDGGGDILLDRDFPLPFTDIQALSGLSTTSPVYLPGANFVAVWVGDPTVSEYVDPVDGGASSPDAGGVFNTGYVHFVMFPSDPVVPAQ